MKIFPLPVDPKKACLGTMLSADGIGACWQRCGTFHVANLLELVLEAELVEGAQWKGGEDAYSLV